MHVQCDHSRSIIVDQDEHFHQRSPGRIGKLQIQQEFTLLAHFPRDKKHDALFCQRTELLRERIFCIGFC